MDRLYDNLLKYSGEDYYPMHMPGHKRNTGFLSMVNPYAIDITEIDGFDNLHQPEGILKQLSVRLKNLYKAGWSFPLVNGSTAGILAAISAASDRGDRILMARNSHKSVYHAAVLRELKPVYIYPGSIGDFNIYGGILPDKVEEALINYPDIKLVVITSPTYEGVVSDIKAIASVVHRHGAVLIVDEAHGAHFGFHKGFPVSAVTLGADLVIQSLHKTLPAFTQTAVLHSNRAELNNKLSKYLAIYQSSSPSYILMAGIDRCLSVLENEADKLFKEYYDMLEAFYNTVRGLSRIKLLDKSIIGSVGVYDLDPSKLVISCRACGLTGHELGELLRTNYHIVMEMEAGDYALGMTSICDTGEGFGRLKAALLDIAGKYIGSSTGEAFRGSDNIKPVQAMAPYEAMEHSTETISLSESCGRIAASFVSIFPPGAPLLTPGEVIDGTFLDYIKKAGKSGLSIVGLSEEDKDRIEVLI